MRLRPTPASAAFVLGALVLTGGAAYSQVARTGGSGDQRMVQQLQQIAQERTALQAENSRLKKDLEQAQADAKSAKAERDTMRAKLAKAEAGKGATTRNSCESVEQVVQTQKQKLEELVGRFRETANTLRATETEKTRAQQAALEKGRAYDGCAKANVEIYEVADEVLKRYSASGVGRADVFTRIARTRMENLVDESRQRIEQLRVQSAEPAPADSGRGPAAGKPDGKPDGSP